MVELKKVPLSISLLLPTSIVPSKTMNKINNDDGCMRCKRLFGYNGCLIYEGICNDCCFHTVCFKYDVDVDYTCQNCQHEIILKDDYLLPCLGETNGELCAKCCNHDECVNREEPSVSECWW